MAEETKITLTLEEAGGSDTISRQIRELEREIAGDAPGPLWRNEPFQNYARREPVSTGAADEILFDRHTLSTLSDIKRYTREQAAAEQEQTLRQEIEADAEPKTREGSPRRGISIPVDYLRDKEFNKEAYIDIIERKRAARAVERGDSDDAERERGPGEEFDSWEAFDAYVDSELRRMAARAALLNVAIDAAASEDKSELFPVRERREHAVYENIRDYLEREITRGINTDRPSSADALTAVWSRQDAQRGITGIPQEILDTFKTLGQRFAQPINSWRAFSADDDSGLGETLTADPRLGELDKLYSSLSDAAYAELRQERIAAIQRAFLFDRLRFAPPVSAYAGWKRGAGARAPQLLLPYYAENDSGTARPEPRVTDPLAARTAGRAEQAEPPLLAARTAEQTERGDSSEAEVTDPLTARARKRQADPQAERKARDAAAARMGATEIPYTDFDTDWGMDGLEFDFEDLGEEVGEEIDKRLTRFTDALDKYRRRGGMQIMRSGASGIGEYARFQGNAYRALGRLRPFDLWSYPETVLAMGQQETNFQRGIGNNLMGIGSGLMMTGNPLGLVGGGAAALFGGGMTLMGSLRGLQNAHAQAALGLTKNIFGGLVKGLETLLSAARTVGGGIMSVARQIVGAITHLLGAGLGLGVAAIGAGAGVVNSAFNQDVRWSNPAFTGVTLSEQLRNEHLEDYWYLSRGSLQSEIVNWNRKSSEFRTQGVFENQVPAALSGMIPLLTSGRTGFDALYEAARALADTARHTSQTQRQDLESWFAQQGLGIVTHMAGQILEGRGTAHRYYAYANQEGAERSFRKNKVEYDAITRAFSDIVKDIGNTLWNNKLPLIGASGRQIAVGAANLLGSVPAALRGDAGGLIDNTRRFAGLALGGLDTAGAALDKWLGRLGFEEPAYRLWRESEPTGRHNTAASRAAWLDSKPLNTPEWTGPWQRLKTAGGHALERGLGLAEVTLAAMKSGQWTPVWNHIAEGVKPIADSAGALISGMFTQGQTILGSLWEWLSGKVTAFFSGDFPQTLMRGFHSFSTWMRETLQGVFDNIDTNSVSAWFKDLGAELIYAFEPAIRFIGRALYSTLSAVSKMIAYSTNPFNFKTSPFTGKNEPFLTEQTGKLYKDFYKTVLEKTGYQQKIGGSIEMDPLQNILQGHNGALSQKIAGDGAFLTNSNVSKETIAYNYRNVTQDPETIELLSRVSQGLSLGRVPADQMDYWMKVVGNTVNYFDRRSDVEQREMLDGKWWQTYGEVLRAGNPADAALNTLMDGYVLPRRAEIEERAPLAARTESRPSVEAVAPAGGAASRVLSELERRVAELTAELKTLREEHARPLRGYVDLRLADGSEHRLEITQEALAGLFSGARGNNPYSQ